tara:strand:+ start:2014 stop:2406 length:393 start_codon:yes stop_codon:yes gene_type:complete
MEKIINILKRYSIDLFLLFILANLNIFTISYLDKNHQMIFILSTIYLISFLLLCKRSKTEKKIILITVIIMGILGSISENTIIHLSKNKTLNYNIDNSIIRVPYWLIPAGYGSMILGSIYVYNITSDFYS